MKGGRKVSEEITKQDILVAIKELANQISETDARNKDRLDSLDKRLSSKIESLDKRMIGKI